MSYITIVALISRLTGRKEIVCQSDGTWSGLVPDCEAISCPAPSPPASGELALETGRGGGYWVGSSVTWRCQPGHVMLGEPLTTCTHRGLWSHATPSCE